MSDADLRELERRWRETGSVEDEATWLLERVRVGSLSQERLEAARALEHDAAVIALEGRLPKGGREKPVPSLEILLRSDQERVTVAVSGDFGLGSGGNENTRAILAGVAEAILEEPSRRVVVDMSSMLYEWGDGAYRIVDVEIDDIEFLLNADCVQGWSGILRIFERDEVEKRVRYEPPLPAATASAEPAPEAGPGTEPEGLWSRLTRRLFGGSSAR